MASLVSCICPTTASRNKYLPLLLRSFLNQDYPDKELVVVSEDEIPLPDHPNIRLVRCNPKLTIGEKRNIACENANGDIIAHFDSDDYSVPGRLTEMLALMKSSNKPVVGYNAITFYNVASKVAYRFKGREWWSCGTALVYKRIWWKNHRFAHQQTGEDSQFVGQAQESDRLVSVNGWDKIIALDHSDNTWERPQIKREWRCDYKPVKETLYPATPPKVLLALLSWNTLEVSRDSVQALLQEKQRLEAAGYLAEVCVCDNGSVDGSQEHWAWLPNIKVIQNPTNLGSSVARNQIIDHALAIGADFTFFNDGDIEVVPWSVLEMAHWLERHPKAGCIGPFYEDCSPAREKVSPHWVKPIEGVPGRLIAWTQYGLFNRQCFSKVRFDETFGPGWGCEDNDYGWQMVHHHGFTPHCFRGMTYLHRGVHSSVTNLAKTGEDTRKIYDQRRAYTLRKWAHVPEVIGFLTGVSWCPSPES